MSTLRRTSDSIAHFRSRKIAMAALGTAAFVVACLGFSQGASAGGKVCRPRVTCPVVPANVAAQGNLYQQNCAGKTTQQQMALPAFDGKGGNGAAACQRVQASYVAVQQAAQCNQQNKPTPPTVVHGPAVVTTTTTPGTPQVSGPNGEGFETCDFGAEGPRFSGQRGEQLGALPTLGD